MQIVIMLFRYFFSDASNLGNYCILRHVLLHELFRCADRHGLQPRGLAYQRNRLAHQRVGDVRAVPRHQEVHTAASGHRDVKRVDSRLPWYGARSDQASGEFFRLSRSRRGRAGLQGFRGASRLPRHRRGRTPRAPLATRTARTGRACPTTRASVAGARPVRCPGSGGRSGSSPRLSLCRPWAS